MILRLGRSIKSALVSERRQSSLLRVAFAVLPILLLAPIGLNSQQAGSLHRSGPSLLRASSATLLLPLLTLLGPQSAQAQQTTTPQPTPQPTLTGGTGRITVSWTNPAGVRLQANRIRYRKKGTSAWTYADASPTSGNQNFAGGATSATVPAYETASHFGDGTTWQVQLRHGKWNEGYGGWGAWSSTAEATTTTFVPPAPSRPVGTRGNTKVSLTWTSGGDGGSAITKWQVQQKAGTGQWSAWSDVCTTSSQANCPSTTSHTVTGLNNNTTYRFKVRAVNTVGNGTASPESNAVTSVTVPSAPTISVTSNVYSYGGGDVTLRWTGIDNGGSQITKFEYARKTGAAGNYGAWQTFCNLTTHPTTCKPPLWDTFSNVIGGKTYYVKARAHNAQGAGAESEGQATLGATWPAAPW